MAGVQLTNRKPDDRWTAPIAVSAPMVDVLRLAQRVAASDAKILIGGESGVGKDVLARFIHHHSARRQAPFVAVNCAGLAESLLESELFGHVRGSFTGAYRDKVGKMKLADRGTLLLDEVGEMSLRMQGLLLRFLENGEIHAVGADGSGTRVDVRVIAATNRHLEERVRAGQFREDLMYRLDVIHLRVPALRDRTADVRPLITHFLKGRRDLVLTEDAWKALERYRWPGNVRELQSIVERLKHLAPPDGPLEVAHLPETVRSSQAVLRPGQERRRQVADELYQAIVSGGYSFWEHIHPLFLERDITRHDIRELVRRGLSVSRGNYRSLLRLFGIPESDYKRFMNFLSTHDCRAEFREFRHGTGELTGEPRRLLPALPPLPVPRAPRPENEGDTPKEKAAS